MSERRELLAFPPPNADAIPPSTRRNPYRPVRLPPASRQGLRLTPQFRTLQNALEQQRAQLGEATTAPDPELVAVFDLAGTVDGFFRAAAQVEGLEFLVDFQEDPVEADDDFYYEQDGEVSDDGVPQSLYMVMTNAQAVTELIRLFGLWQQDQSMTFERGLGPLKQVFGLLRSIRQWGPQDRVRETGLLEQWREDVEVVGTQGTTRVEVELWYRDDSNTRATALADVVDLIETAGGLVVTSCDWPAITYQAVLADVPMAQVERVLAQGPDSIELLTTERVMFVSPSRPMSFPAGEPVSRIGLRFDKTASSGRPRVALLDGVPLANHTALAERLIIDDPDNHTSRYTMGQRRHCSAMASLIAHGDLSAPGPAARLPLYVRPILQPKEHFDDIETFPPNELLVDVVYRAFHRMFEGDGSHSPAASSVRIVNLSIGDPARVFVRKISPLARLLDWLAHKYNLVIVVSAGNQDLVQPALPARSLDDIDLAAAAAAKSLHEQARTRRLLSPAEAINVITVGAVHDDAAEDHLPDTVIDLLPRGTPASYTPCGFGFRRSVKPEILLPGGRQVFRSPPVATTDVIKLSPADTAATGPGLCVASPGLNGELDAFSFGCGTSNAAALATREVSSIFDVLETLNPDNDELPFPDPQYHPVLAKTLLVHGAGWHDLRDRMRRTLGLTGHQIRRELTRVLGYGLVRPDRVATADRVRVLLLGAGSIGKNQRHSFVYPLPNALSATTMWRRLTITLGWMSPISVRSQKYRVARLSFVTAHDVIGVDPTEGDHNAVFKGTVQHQVFEGERAVAFVDGTNLVVDVDCRVDGRLDGLVRYGLAASVELSAAIQVDLHAQVRARLREAVRLRARTQGS